MFKDVCWGKWGEYAKTWHVMYYFPPPHQERYGSKGRFAIRWRSALVGQEFQPKTWLFEARDGMLEKIKDNKKI